jgi:hypothetical protein
MIIRFRPVSTHKECTHFLINEVDKERLDALNLINGKLYPLYYDEYDDEYYVVDETGTRSYCIDLIVKVKMLQQQIN